MTPVFSWEKLCNFDSGNSILQQLLALGWLLGFGPGPQQLRGMKPSLWSHWRGASQEEEARECQEQPPPERLQGP